MRAAEAVWISNQTAQQRHVERLIEIVQAAEGMVICSPEEQERIREFVSGLKVFIVEHGGKVAASDSDGPFE